MRRPVHEEEAAGVRVGGCAGIGVDTVAKHSLLCLSTNVFAVDPPSAGGV
jgi:hypothetical protein